MPDAVWADRKVRVVNTAAIAGKPGSHLGLHSPVGAGLARDEARKNALNVKAPSAY
ncbi:hypothetical protein METHPM2_890027 [Pseudomonas sp. PM2]